MADAMVLKTQQWLNATYGKKQGFGKVTENGITGWDTIYGLTRALQIELGITALANNFGPATQTKFKNRWPNGIAQQSFTDSSKSNVYAIIQGALWCKGYASEYGDLTCTFKGATGSAIKSLKSDMGFGDGSTVDLEIMKTLLSMMQFKLIRPGKETIRSAQRFINKTYRAYTGIIPTDGLYGREMNTALIQVLQAIEGYSPADATGNFGAGTRSKLKTITASNASSNQSWLWLATTSLTCNGFGKESTNTWTNDTSTQVTDFQKLCAISATGTVDPTTWMSLLTSKGDPNRKALACDTRFEVTDELLAKLKSDGFRIVGRYLTEPGQDKLSPSNYFKAIRPGELERIIRGGMKFFPIFQEYSTRLSDFTAAKGAQHAVQAAKAAQRLHIPPTHIYFAVDFDATDPQVDSNILPYFKAIKDNIPGNYNIGIYASRNICKRVKDAGYATSMFISDMSTGFSGNLGFPMPGKWTFDQFTEISGYGGKWDLDKVAYSGAAEAVSTLTTMDTPAASVGTSINTNSTDYQHMDVFSLIWHLEKRYAELRGNGVDRDLPVYRGILNYLAKAYLRDGGKESVFAWNVSVEKFRNDNAATLENDATGKKIIAALDKYLVGSDRLEIKDRTGGRIDLAHLAATCLGYVLPGVVPVKWKGWAGDLATGIGNIKRVATQNSGAPSLSIISKALIGAGNDWDTKPPLSSLKLAGVTNSCNFSDLCCDADAICLSDTLRRSKVSTHLLSGTLLQCYNRLSSLQGRFKVIATSQGAYTQEDAAALFYREMTVTDNIASLVNPIFIKLLKGSADQPYVQAATTALAQFVFK